MKPIHKLSGTICNSCRTIITESLQSNDLLCPKCQNKSVDLLVDLYITVKDSIYSDPNIYEDEDIQLLKDISVFLKDI